MKVTNAVVLSMLAAGACVFGTTRSADAGIVVGFDDITTQTFAIVADGYWGFDWDHFSVIDRSYQPNSGYWIGTTSPDYVAFNHEGDPASLRLMNNGLFDFNQATFTAAWNNGLNITIDGLVEGQVTHTQTIEVDTTGSILAVLNFTNIDEIRFTSFGGIDAGLSDFFQGTHFAMDDMMVSIQTVPAPGVLGLLGIMGVTAHRRRRRNS